MDKLNIKIQCGRGTVGEWSEMNVPKGPHTFFVRGTDNVNNVGEWKSYTFDVGEGKIITFCTIIITLSFEGAPGCRGGGGWMDGGGGGVVCMKWKQFFCFDSLYTTCEEQRKLSEVWVN